MKWQQRGAPAALWVLTCVRRAPCVAAGASFLRFLCGLDVAVRRGGRGEGEQSEASFSIILGSPPRTVSGDRPQPPQAGRGGLGALAAYHRRNCPFHGAALSQAGVLAALL